MTVVHEPHECDVPSDVNDGTVWQCDGCGKLRQVWGFLIVPVGPFKRWRLRRKGLLPIPPECDYCWRRSDPAHSTDGENFCESCAPALPADTAHERTEPDA